MEAIRFNLAMGQMLVEGGDVEQNLRRAEGRWQFAYGRALAESSQLTRGWWQMACSLIADQRGLAYKLSYMVLILLSGREKVTDAQARLKQAKDHLIGRRTTEISL